MSKDKRYNTNAFKKLRNEWYGRLDDSGFIDIERAGRRRKDLYNERSGYLRNPTSVLRHKYNIFTYIYYDIARYLSYNATFLPKIDRKVLELHGDGYTIQRISTYLRENFKYPLNKKGRKGKPYSVFYVHTKLKYLKLLIILYTQTEDLDSVKKSWQSI